MVWVPLEVFLRRIIPVKKMGEDKYGSRIRYVLRLIDSSLERNKSKKIYKQLFLLFKFQLFEVFEEEGKQAEDK